MLRVQRGLMVCFYGLFCRWHVCPQVFILEGAGMQAAAYINPNQDDLSTYQNVQQSMLLRFAIAAVWFLILGLAQVRAGAVICGGCIHQ